MNARWILPILALGIGYAGARIFMAPEPPVHSPQTLPSAVAAAPPSLSTPAKPPEGSVRRHAYDFARVAELQAFPSFVHRMGGLQRYFRTLEQEDFPAAFSDLLGKGVDSREALGCLVRNWAVFAPGEALKQAQRAEGALRADLIAAVMKSWGDRDLAVARAAAGRLSGADQEAALACLKDVDAFNKSRIAPPAPQPTLSNRETFWRNTQVSETGASWNPKAEAAFAKWAREDPEGAAKELAASSLASNGEFLGHIYDAWNERDPAKGKAFLDSLTEYQREKLYTERIGKMAEQDFSGALAVVESFKDPETRGGLLDTLGFAVFPKNPEAGINLLLSLSEEARTTYYPRGLVKMWLRHDPERAAAWLRNDPVFGRTFRSGKNDRFFLGDGGDVLASWLARDPVAAATFATEFTAEELPDLMEGVGKVWIRSDPKGAVRWAASLPEGTPLQAEALKQFVYLWAEHDVKASTAFLGALPTGSGKNGAAEGFAFSVMDDDPDAALAWVRVISEDSKRLDVLGRAWSDWHRKNARAASDWLANNKNLTPSERSALEER